MNRVPYTEGWSRRLFVFTTLIPAEVRVPRVTIVGSVRATYSMWSPVAPTTTPDAWATSRATVGGTKVGEVPPAVPEGGSPF
jgi:hypothetical protein